MNSEYCVYKHTDTEGKIYIGITCQSSEKLNGATNTTFHIQEQE